MKHLVILLSFFFLLSNSYSQNATIKGKLYENVDGKTQPLPYANAYLEGTTYGATTDFDGNFEFKAPAGQYVLVCSFMVYETIKKPVTLVPNTETTVSLEMKAKGIDLKEVEIIAKVNRESEMTLVLEQKKAAITVERLGASELSRKGASSVGAGVKKMAGVSMMGSDQLFVRGMGDRYNNLTFNELPLASPNPDRKIIPLDIFPSEIVQNIALEKVYSVKNYANYAGANIDITTKDYSEEPFFEIEIGSGFNTAAINKTFKVASSPASKGQAYFGLGAEARYKAMPDFLSEIKITPYKNFPSEPYGSDFSYTIGKGQPEIDLKLTGGNTFKLRNDQKLGTLFAVSFENEYSTETGYDMTLNAQGGINTAYLYDKYTYLTNLTGLANLAYLINSKNSIKFNFLTINSSEDRFKVKEGKSAEGDIRTINNYRIRFYTLFNNQLLGDHKINDQLKLNWKASLSNAHSSEPDRRSMTYEKEYGENYYTLYTLDQQASMRYFNKFTEDEINGGLNLKYLLNQQGSENGSITIGADSRVKSRDFICNKSYYNLDAVTNDSIDPAKPTDLINDAAFADSSILLKNFSVKEDQYDAKLWNHAAYIDFTNKWGDFTLNAGIRWEYFFMEANFTYGGVDYSKVSIPFGLYPALNLKYELNSNTNLRLSASRTVTYPNFTEFAPLLYSEYGELSSIGNPDLEAGFNNNFDLRWEFFPQPGDVLSVNLFGKLLENPIEKTAITVAGDQGYSYQNTDNGKVAGIEIEGKKKYKGLFAGANLSFIYSYIKLPENSANTTKERQLQGASPLLANADLGYQYDFGANKHNYASLSAIYNVYSQRLYAVGVSGRGDVYENAFNTLDFIVKVSLQKKLGFSFKARNVLNQDVEYIQEFVDANNNIQTHSIEKYKKGTKLSFDISYKF